MGGVILTGTASWTDPGFVAEWYPRDLPAGYRLRWYAEHFRLVEVNSTFYRIPEARTAKGWCEQTPEGFVFDAKLHRYLSRHSTKLELLPPDLRSHARITKDRVELTPRLERAVAKRFLEGLEPFRECGKSGALLLQLSPAFSPRRHRLAELDSLLGALEGWPLAVELRNQGWVTGENLDETKRFFRSRKLAFVMVDAPVDPHFTVLPSIDLVTDRRLSYLRAHGRNARGYVRGRTVADRFDYEYSQGELKEIAGRANAAATKARRVHVIFNNNKADYAPRAAAELQELRQKEGRETRPDRRGQEELAYR